MKKLLSVLLVVLMLVGMLPMNAIHTHAAETTETLNIYGSTGTMSGTSSISWTSNGVTFTNYKASSTTAIRTSDTSYYRVYANSEVEVTAPGNITKIVITSTGSSYNTPWVNSASAIGTASNSGNVITVVPTTPAKTLKFSATAQVRLSSIEITYSTDDSGDSGETYTVSFSVPDGVESVADQECSSAGITLPTAGVPTGDYSYTFAGWVAEEVDNKTEAPTVYAEGDTYKATKDTTLYALYTYSVAGEGTGSTEYVLTDIANIKATDEVVITMTYQSTVYALNSGNGTSSAPAATTVTVSNQKLSATPDPNLIWNIETTSDGYIIYPNGTTATWLYCTATNNGVRVGTNTANTFVVDASSGYLKHTGTSRYLGVYRTTPDWRCYTNTTGNTANQTLGFYVKSSGASSTTYYTTVISSTSTECEHTNTTTTTVDATCTAAGSTTVTCDDCGATVSTTEIPALGHSYGTGVVTAPTCIAEGYTTYTCSACGHSYTDNKTEPTGEHTYVDGICSVCGAEEPSTSATEWQLVTNASTLAAGDRIVIVAQNADVALSTTQNDNNRGQAGVEKSTNTSNVAVVTFGDDVQVITLETGTTDGTFAFYVKGNSTGYLYAASSGSNYLRTEGTLSANSSWTISIDSDGNATIKAQGTNTRNWLRYNSSSSIFSCYASGQGDIAIYRETIVCEHKNTVDVAEVSATCTTVGYTAGKQCTECGAYTEGHEEIPALGHSYDDGVVTTAPGCTTTGVKTFTCSACGNTYTETVAATGHENTTTTTVDATCTVDGSVTVTCDDCGTVISSTTIPAGHSWDEGKVTTEATCEEPGVTTYTCSVCSDTKEEEIAALGHSWNEGEDTTAATCETDGVKTYTCTRDESHTKTEAIPATGHSYSVDENGEYVCTNCGDTQEVIKYELVTDITDILEGGTYVIAALVGEEYVAINNTVTSNPGAVAVQVSDGTYVIDSVSDPVPTWKVGWVNGISVTLMPTGGTQYLGWSDGTSFTAMDEEYRWTVKVGDEISTFELYSTTTSDRAINYGQGVTPSFSCYSTNEIDPTDLYFFRLVTDKDVSAYTVTFVENGVKTGTMTVETENEVAVVEEMPGAFAEAPAGYTFYGWLSQGQEESLYIRSDANLYQIGEAGTFSGDTILYALYTRHDANDIGLNAQYNLVTSTDDLTPGGHYVIVASYGGSNTNYSGYYAMTADQQTKTRGAVLVTKLDDNTVQFGSDDNVAIFQLAIGSEAGSYAFLDTKMGQFLYCDESSSSYGLKSQATLDETASFTITMDENGLCLVTFLIDGYDGRNMLKFNYNDVSNLGYGCYKEASGNMSCVELYKGVSVDGADYYTTIINCEHKYVYDENSYVAPGCETSGYGWYICEYCGDQYVEEIAPAHTAGEAVEKNVVAATCTAVGSYDSVVYCTVCDAELSRETSEIAALGHDYDAEKGEVVTSSSGYYVVVYPCVRNCGAEHEAAQLRFQDASLTLENNIVVNFKTCNTVAGDSTYAGFSGLYAVFTYGNRVGEKAIATEGVDLGDGRYNLACRRVTPSQIGDEITATLYGTYEGKEYSFTMTYSAAEYCYTMLGTTTDTELQTLLVDLLYYCDAARAYTTYQGVDVDYKYYGSVTDELTETQKTYRKVSNEFTSVMGLSGEGEFAATWQSASLIIGDTTSIQFRVDMGGTVLTQDMIQVTVARNAYSDVRFMQDGDTWLIRVDGLAAHQMSDTVSVTLSSGGTAISKTVSYSVESYAANKMNDTNEKLKNMLIAMMSYGDAAAAYKA